MCGVSLRERKTNAELRKSLGSRYQRYRLGYEVEQAEMDGSCAEER